MLNFLHENEKTESYGIRERLISRIIIFGMCLCVLATAEIFIFTTTYYSAIPLVVLFFVLFIAHLLVSKKEMFEAAAMIVQISVLFLAFPCVFLLSGGVMGGSPVWYVLGLFYSIGIFKGLKMYILTGLTIIIDGLTYYVGIAYPDLLKYNATNESVYVDSFFAVVFVGILLGIVLKIEIKYYNKERLLAVEQKEEIAKFSKDKSDFFTSMSHEIRTPINTIIGLNEVNLRDVSLSDEQADNCLAIQNASKMLLSLINDILDVSKIESKKMQIYPVEYRTKDLFEDLVDMIKIRMEEKALDFIVDIDSEMPSVLYGDDKRLKQVVINLLTNAVKYTKKGSVTLEAHVDKLGEEWCKLSVSVIDTGVGIKVDNIEHLFETFKRVENEENKYIEGTGLGLSISQKLMTLMDGEIFVDSIYTKGSTFTISLEQKIINSKPIGNFNFLSNTGRSREIYRQSFEAPEGRILVVDDNEMNRAVLKKLLKATKLKMDMASSGQECLALTQEKYYHLILMDYLMPQMDGAETLKEIRRQENGLCKNTPVIVLTADTSLAMVDTYSSMGFSSILEKPIRGKILENVILSFLPEEIIEYRINASDENSSVLKLSNEKIKKKKILITAECVCDLPESICEENGIKLIYTYVNVDDNRFADSSEIDSTVITQMLLENSKRISAEAAPIEDYEKFFADCLLETEDVIHLSVGSGMGAGFYNSCTAAKGFDHVVILDTGNLSGGYGLNVLMAAKMANDGENKENIIKEINRVSGKIHSTIILPDVNAFYINGYINHYLADFFNYMHLYPLIKNKNKCLNVFTFMAGNLENASLRMLRKRVLNNRKVSGKVIYITYAGIPVRLQEKIRKEVEDSKKFDKIIMNRSSVTNACFSGIGTVAVAFVIEK